MQNFGDTLIRLRKEKGLSRIELIKKMEQFGIKTTENMLGKWERNYSIPNVQQFFALCEALDVDNINAAFHVVEKEDPEQVLNEKGMERVREYTRLLSKDAQFCH